MSLFDFDYSAVTNIVDPLSPVCGSNNTKSYELLGYPHLNAGGPVFGADVIPADYDFSADLLEEPEHSMNLEVNLKLNQSIRVAKSKLYLYLNLGND